MKKPLIVDAHEDLAWNMLTFGRDYMLSSRQIREREAVSLAPRVNGDSMLGWADYQQGNIGLIFATLFSAPLRAREGDWDVLTYADQQEAHEARAGTDARGHQPGEPVEVHAPASSRPTR